MTQNTKSFEKSLETLASVNPIPMHMQRAEVVVHLHLTTGNDVLCIYLHWVGFAADEAFPYGGHIRMKGDLCSIALHSIYIRLTASSDIYCTGWLGVKCSKSQARVLDE
ncbi:hypothetical protein TNCV_3666441 [Trichonephila clavipes]|uniref:Uncharacterized protein n=1 Tax=Trichonephila clavipes TaxID=2585209 RepID=A0A8X6RYY5_TRICX|nr:hypothetical protein TNCV_3666441 [Trichonephila clavipes]